MGEGKHASEIVSSRRSFQSDARFPFLSHAIRVLRLTLMWRSYELFCDIHLTKVNFFCALRSKTCPFRRNPPQRFSVHCSKRTKFPHFWGQLLRDIAQLYSDLGTLSSTSSSSTPKLQNIRSKVSMTRSSLWGDITKLRTKSKNKGNFLK